MITSHPPQGHRSTEIDETPSLEKWISTIPFFKSVSIKKIERLLTGKNNQNFKIHSDSEIFFLKIFHTSEIQKINRQVEYSILQQAYHQGLGVKPLAIDLKTRSIVTEFVALPSWTLQEIQTESALHLFGKSIRKINEMPLINYSYFIQDLLERYWNLLKETESVKNIIDFFEHTWAKIQEYRQESDIRFCHNDLCYGHFLRGEQILFLDWEMAGMNDFYSEIAGFIHFHRLDEQQIELFLQSYSRQDINREKLSIHQNAILLRELLWTISKIREGCSEHFYIDYKKRCLSAIMKRQKSM